MMSTPTRPEWSVLIRPLVSHLYPGIAPMCIATVVGVARTPYVILHHNMHSRIQLPHEVIVILVPGTNAAQVGVRVGTAIDVNVAVVLLRSVS